MRIAPNDYLSHSSLFRSELENISEVQGNDEHKKEFIAEKNVRGLIALKNRASDAWKGAENFAAFKRSMLKKRLKRASLALTASTALVVFTFVASWFLFKERNHKKEEAVAMNEIFVPSGQRLQMTLKDGTVVWLNSKSTISYPDSFNGNERRVNIEGEAMFDVAKDKERPFVVFSNGFSVKAVGTKFNVRAYPEEKTATASLLEGSVIVDSKYEEGNVVKLSPGQQFILDDENSRVEKITDDEHFLWVDGIYCFNDVPMLDVLHNLELYYDVKLLIKAPEEFDWNFTGKFRQNDGIMQILHLLQKFHYFEITIDKKSNDIIIG